MHHFKACTQQEYETMLKTGYTFIKSKVPVNVGDTIVCQVDASQYVAEVRTWMYRGWLRRM